MSNQYVVDGLRVKLAEIQSAIRTTEQRLKVLASERETVIKALRLFDDQGQAGTFSLGIATGSFARTILETIRDSDFPLCARDIAERLATRSEKPLDKSEMQRLLGRVRNGLSRLSDQLDGELRDRTTYLRVKV